MRGLLAVMLCACATAHDGASPNGGGGDDDGSSTGSADGGTGPGSNTSVCASTCDDGDACTSDVCDPALNMCMHTPLPGAHGTQTFAPTGA
ncbi:MAG TPA: hypothetical protein VGC41_27615, partial [Kofleriaceae bacterium]